MTFDNTRPHSSDRLTLAELDLYHRIMAYRAEHDLDPIPLSTALTTTAGRHAADTIYNIWGADLQMPRGTNLHSWSDAPYYEDHRDPEVMWYAPERYGITYASEGLEISAFGYADNAAALNGWKGSSGHNDVILNLNSWESMTYRAMGVGLLSDPDVDAGTPIYHVWFGTLTDPAGPPRIQGNARANDILGTAFADRIQGRAGGDTLRGQDGRDALSGDAGADRLNGGADADRLNGGAGSDTLTGAGGGDTFIFSGRNFGTDRIEDFGAGDRIRMTSANEAGSFAEFMAATGTNGTDAIYDRGQDGRNVIILADLAPGELQAGMFDFG